MRLHSSLPVRLCLNVICSACHPLLPFSSSHFFCLECPPHSSHLMKPALPSLTVLSFMKYFPVPQLQMVSLNSQSTLFLFYLHDHILLRLFFSGGGGGGRGTGREMGSVSSLLRWVLSKGRNHFLFTFITFTMMPPATLSTQMLRHTGWVSEPFIIHGILKRKWLSL